MNKQQLDITYIGNAPAGLVHKQGISDSKFRLFLLLYPCTMNTSHLLYQYNEFTTHGIPFLLFYFCNAEVSSYNNI
jgi:hypothetical protein